MKKEYDGVIAEMIFHNSENGYTVAVFEINGEEAEEDYFTVVGTMPGAAAGKTYHIAGEFVENPRYGEQFAVRGNQRLPGFRCNQGSRAKNRRCNCGSLRGGHLRCYRESP